LYAQDSTSKPWTFRKQFELWYKWQNHAVDANVTMPGYISADRRLNNQLPVSFDTITDNPLRHGATYVVLKTQTDYLNKVSLFADLYAEHRGSSYGLFDQNNTVVFPVTRLEAKDTLKIFSKELKVKGRVGQFLNERMDEGLMVYNIDVQGLSLEANYKSFTLGYTLYGDLTRGIGLNIDDLESYSLTHSFNNDLNIGISWVMAIPSYEFLKKTTH
jgi:hypothetical protein